MKQFVLIATLTLVSGSQGWTSVFAAPPETKSANPTVERGRSLEVIDAAGKTVGAVVGTDIVGNAVVPLRINGVVVLVAVSRDGFDYALSPALAFQSTDCTGQAYVFATDKLVPGSAAAPPGQTLYAQSGPAENVALGSLFESGVCSSFAVTTQVAPAAPQVDLSSLFTTPFGVVLK